MYRSGKGSPHSHRTPVDAVPTTAGIPSTRSKPITTVLPWISIPFQR